MMQINDTTVLKPLEAEDGQRIFDAIDAEREYMRVWLPFVDRTTDVSYTQSFVDAVLQSPDQQFCICSEGKLIGFVGFKDTDTDNYKTEIGYWLSASAQGKGIMHASVLKLVDYAFDTLDMNRIQIKAAVENKPSRAVAEKAGFTLEGIEREAELLVGDVFTDLAVYSLLKKEYRK